MPKFVAIGREQFSKLHWTAPQNYGFAVQATVAPITAAEIARVIPAMPMCFLRQNNQFQLAALMSLAPSRNMFVGPNGQWLGGYVPASIRSFPFKLIRPQGSADPVLCIDEESGLVTNDAATGEAFFDPDGSVAPKLKSLLDFLGEVDRNHHATQIAVASLEQAGVITEWPLMIKNEQGEQKIEGLFRIDESSLNALPEDRFAKIRATGALPIAYGQLFSMLQLSVFQNLMKIQSQLAPKPVGPLPDTLDKLFDSSNNEYLRFD